MSGLGRTTPLIAAGVDTPVARVCYLVETDADTLGTGTIPPAKAIEDYSKEAVAAFPVAGQDFNFSLEAVLPQPLPLKLSSEPYRTDATDPDRPSEQWDFRLLNPGTLSHGVKLNPLDSPRIEPISGSIKVDNTDGLYDQTLNSRYIVNQTIEIRIGDPVGAYGDFAHLYTVRIVGVETTERDVTLQVGDSSQWADRVFEVETYQGSGNAEGPTGLAGTQKPYAYGVLRNVSPILVDRVNLIYQVHGGAITSVDAVYDGGVPLVQGSDYATFALLKANPPASGDYATCLAEGFVMLGDTPQSQVTIDLHGDAAAGDTLRSIADFFADALATSTGTTYDAPSFATLPQWEAGWYWTDAFTYGQALDRFVGDAGFFWGAFSVEKIGCSEMVDPETATPVAAIREYDMIALERVKLPRNYERIYSRQVVRYARNWTVQTGSDLLGAVYANDYGIEFKSNEWRYTAFSSQTLGLARTEPEPHQSGLATAGNAITLAQKIIELHGEKRRMFRVRTVLRTSLISLSDVVTLDYPRFGLSGGRPFVVIAYEVDMKQSQVTYTLWG